MQEQTDDYNCILFAIAFATGVLKGFSPANSCFNVSIMYRCLLECFEIEEFTFSTET